MSGSLFNPAGDGDQSMHGTQGIERPLDLDTAGTTAP
jgi:hypothetical protein